jgi:hypothetical protein
MQGNFMTRKVLILRTLTFNFHRNHRDSFLSRSSSVGIATGYGLDDRLIGVRFPAGLGIFFFDTMSRPALWHTQPPIQWVLGALSLGVKRPGGVADHLPPSSSQGQECVVLCLHSPIRLQGLVLN